MPLSPLLCACHTRLLIRCPLCAAVAHILFNEMDADGSGSLDRGEIEHLCERLGKKMTSEQIDAAMVEMDEHKNGSVDADEFVHWWINHGGRTYAPQ